MKGLYEHPLVLNLTRIIIIEQLLLFNLKTRWNLKNFSIVRKRCSPNYHLDSFPGSGLEKLANI